MLMKYLTLETRRVSKIKFSLEKLYFFTKKIKIFLYDIIKGILFVHPLDPFTTPPIFKKLLLKLLLKIIL